MQVYVMCLFVHTHTRARARARTHTHKQTISLPMYPVHSRPYVYFNEFSTLLLKYTNITLPSVLSSHVVFPLHDPDQHSLYNICFICICILITWQWVNGHLVLSHEIGHLPFQADITSVVKFGAKNRVTVAVDNILLQTSVPQGHISEVTT